MVNSRPNSKRHLDKSMFIMNSLKLINSWNKPEEEEERNQGKEDREQLMQIKWK